MCCVVPPPLLGAPSPRRQHESVSRGQSPGDGFCPLCVPGTVVSVAPSDLNITFCVWLGGEASPLFLNKPGKSR